MSNHQHTIRSDSQDTLGHTKMNHIHYNHNSFVFIYKKTPPEGQRFFSLPFLMFSTKYNKCTVPSIHHLIFLRLLGACGAFQIVYFQTPLTNPPFRSNSPKRLTFCSNSPEVWDPPPHPPGGFGVREYLITGFLGE